MGVLLLLLLLLVVVVGVEVSIEDVTVVEVMAPEAVVEPVVALDVIELGTVKELVLVNPDTTKLPPVVVVPVVAGQICSNLIVRFSIFQNL